MDFFKDREKIQVVTMILGVVGVLFFLAGYGFDLMDSNTAAFLGIAAFIVSGGLWGINGSVGGDTKKKK